MERFAIAQARPSAEELQARLTITALPDLCPEITKVLRDDGDTGAIFCLWGSFDIHRQPIRGGMRFTLPTCPNGLSVTLTTGYPPAPEEIVIHCTINRPEAGVDPDFKESIEEFVAAWKTGLEAAFAPV